MKDTELRGVVLEWFYRRRDSDWVTPRHNEMPEAVEFQTFMRICDQLSEQNMLHWKPIGADNASYLGGAGKITARGVDVYEGGGLRGSFPIELPVLQTINISHSQNIQIGSYNTQQLVVMFEQLLQQIEESPAAPEEKREAKGRLAAFLKHPIVSSVAADVATTVLMKMGGLA